METNTGEDRLPLCLILGDSISIGYTPFVTEGLAGSIDVVHNPGNAESSWNGVDQLSNWIGSFPDPDIVHFNFGLWDLAFRGASGSLVGEDLSAGRIVADETQYRSNLEIIVNILKATGGNLIWASTTVIPEGARARKPGSEITYNEIAAGVMRGHGVPVNDLHACSVDAPAGYQRNRNVHFTDQGHEYLAAAVIKFVQNVAMG